MMHDAWWSPTPRTRGHTHEHSRLTSDRGKQSTREVATEQTAQTQQHGELLLRTKALQGSKQASED